MKRSSCCDAARENVGRVGRLLAIACFFHCILFLVLIVIATLGTLPGAGHWLPFLDNPILHLLFGGAAVGLVSVHLYLHRKSVPRRALIVALLGSAAIGGSLVGEFVLHSHFSSTTEQAIVCHGCFHEGEHYAFHILFMVGNVCLFTVHQMVHPSINGGGQ